ncbi:two-component system, sensor histidine kinase YesM [Treponema bryantii]|uniref:Two-component system, sensor histidine kinase YesM n=1 Tax=Treponema bryantii TaxID=163 RepID=A0A1H9HZU8_9SPIR|nr:histidine kinase [Treponema bryantii]BDC93037.1 histidine kinase [Treponema bryantii]SEQ67881.1 two-component system, sensor histidine kinase YesM [Treponema bryantii]
MKNTSLRRTLLKTYISLLFIAFIPTIYSSVVTQIHIRQYSQIISNVGTANNINSTVKNDIPAELWNIISGKQAIQDGNQYHMLDEVYAKLSLMLMINKNAESRGKLEVANRTTATLRRNIDMLISQMKKGSTVTQNEATLDEIRTITSLFSDIMQDFIVTEIESANKTNQSLRNTSIILAALQIIITIIAIIISINGFIKVSDAIEKPISDMENLSTKVAHGDLTARIDIPHVDELDTLAANLNTMTSQIDVLIKKNMEEQKNFQKAEMKALQAQITPHFLYNTFDTIVWLAEEEKTDEVVRITKAFSQFLRISLSRGHEWITISQELDHIQNYLTIQKIRYADILNYTIDADEDLMDIKMIKLVLQPLIENAIYHGIKNKRGRGELKVSVHYSDETKNFIRFVVEDNGAGFTEERLGQVRNELRTGAVDSEKLSSVYGLYNVNKKLKLYYGDQTDGLIIESEAGKGSKISFTIPSNRS